MAFEIFVFFVVASAMYLPFCGSSRFCGGHAASHSGRSSLRELALPSAPRSFA